MLNIAWIFFNIIIYNLEIQKYNLSQLCDQSWSVKSFQSQLVLFNSVCKGTFAFLDTCLELSSEINVLYHVTNPSLTHGFHPGMKLNQLFLKWMLAFTVLRIRKKFCLVQIIYIFHVKGPALSWKDNCHNWFIMLSFLITQWL